jgi:hypothetical protein
MKGITLARMLLTYPALRIAWAIRFRAEKICKILQSVLP